MYDILIGKNIILRKAKVSDYESMFKNVWGDEEVYKWMLFSPTLTIEDAILRTSRSIDYQKDHYAYFVALKDTDEAIGLCAISEYEPNRWEENGICIGTKYQGLGYGKEVVSLLLDLAFNKFNAIDFEYAYFKDNIKSKNLASKFNFKYVYTKELIRPWDNEKKIIDYALLSRRDYMDNIIETERLILRHWKIEDSEAMFKYASEPEVGIRCGFPPHTSIDDSIKVVKSFIENNPECYAIVLKDSNEAIGCIELMKSRHSDREDEMELGYWLGKPYWGLGYMTEAADAIINYGFKKYDLNAIWCAYYDGNIGSKRVQEKLGFVYQYSRDNVDVVLLNEKRKDHVNLLTKEHWLELKKSVN